MEKKLNISIAFLSLKKQLKGHFCISQLPFTCLAYSKFFRYFHFLLSEKKQVKNNQSASFWVLDWELTNHSDVTDARNIKHHQWKILVFQKHNCFHLLYVWKFSISVIPGFMYQATANGLNQHSESCHCIRWYYCCGLFTTLSSVEN